MKFRARYFLALDSFSGQMKKQQSEVIGHEIMS
jgi:hypothetical protein